MNEQAVLDLKIRAIEQLNGIDAYIDEILEARKQTNKWVRDTNKKVSLIEKSLKKLSNGFKKLNSAIKKVRDVALKAFTALVALNSIPIKFYSNFEKELSNVNTLLNVSRQELKKYEKDLISLSNNTGKAVTELSKGLYDVVSAGVDSGNSLSVLNKATKASQAGITNVNTAVKAGISTINAYNLELSELNKVYDLQFSTVKQGIITYEDLANNMGKLLPSASKLNVELKEVYGSIAFLTKQGQNAEIATTSLARSFDSLIEKSDKIEENFGFSIFDDQGNFVGYETVIGKMAEQMQGLSDQSKIAKLEMVGFEQRASRAIIPAINNFDQFKEVLSGVSNSANSMEEAYRRATDNIAFNFNRVKESAINSLRAFGSIFREDFIELSQRLIVVLKDTPQYIEQNKEAILDLIKYAGKITLIVSAIALVGSALMSLMSPIGAITAGIFVLASAWYINLYDIQGKTEQAWQFIKDKYDELVKKGVIDKIKNYGKMAIKIALEFTGELWNNIQNGEWDKVFTQVADLAIKLVLAKATINTLKTSIIEGLGLVSASGIKTAGASILGLITVGVRLKQAMEEGNFEDFGKDMAVALAAGLGIGLFTGSPQAGILVFTVLVNFKIGSTIWDDLFNFQKDNKSYQEWLKGNNTLDSGYVPSWVKEQYDENGNYIKKVENINTDSINVIDKYAPDYVKQATGYATGGKITGEGTGTSDSILARVSNGEYIVNARQTKKFLPLLESINNGQLPAYATGGYIGLDKLGVFSDYEMMYNQGYISQSTYKQGIGASNWNMKALKESGLDQIPLLVEISKNSNEKFGDTINLFNGFMDMVEKFNGDMDKIKKESFKIFKETQNIGKNSKEQTKHTKNLPEILGSMSIFANNIANVTGSEGWGVAGSVLGQGNKLWNQIGNFESATNQFTAGLGIVGTVSGIFSSLDNYFSNKRQEELEKIRNEYLENSKDIREQAKKQLELTKQVANNTETTSKNIIKAVSQNPTLTNISKAQDVFKKIEELSSGKLIPEILVSDIELSTFMQGDGTAYFKTEFSKSIEEFLQPFKTVPGYDYLYQVGGLGSQYSIDGSIQEMNMEELLKFNQEMQNLTTSDLEELAMATAGLRVESYPEDSEDRDRVLGDIDFETNFDEFIESLDKYTEMRVQLEKYSKDLAGISRLESFEGINYLSFEESKKQYKEQFEKYYEASGLDSSNYAEEIEEFATELAKASNEQITIMNNVRGSFKQAFSEGNTLLESFASSMKSYFDTLKSNIAGLFYDIELDSLNSKFEEFFGNISNAMKDYSKDESVGLISFITGQIDSNGLDSIFEEMAKLEEKQQNMDTIVDTIREKAQQAGLSDDIIDLMLPSTETSKKAQEIASTVRNALSNAMNTALKVGNDFTDFSKSIGESIYNNAKQALIKAFSETEIYKKYFEVNQEEINALLEGVKDPKKAFNIISDYLDGVRQTLKDNDLDFGYNEAPTESNTSGDSIGNTDYSGASVSGESATIINNDYIFSPTIGTVLGDEKELFRKFQEFIKQEQATQA